MVKGLSKMYILSTFIFFANFLLFDRILQKIQFLQIRNFLKILKVELSNDLSFAIFGGGGGGKLTPPPAYPGFQLPQRGSQQGRC